MNYHKKIENNANLMIQKESFEHFDVIVIGAGLGGLAAAAELAHSKKKVLLLEKHNAPGGFATSFVRGRFEFEAALHELNSIGTEENPGSLFLWFQELGLTQDRLKFYQVPELYSCVFYDGEKYDLPFGVDNFTHYLIERFPEEEAGIRNLMRICSQIYEGMNNKVSIKTLFKYPWLIRVLGLNIIEFLERFLKNRRLINVVAQYWCYLGGTPSDGNAVLFVGALMSYLVKGAAFPSLRSHNLSSLIASTIEQSGGIVKYNALVDEILFKDNLVSGVRLINGEIYTADAIISNVNPICTIMKMMPQKQIKKLPKKYIGHITSPQIGPSIFSVYLGLNKSPEELGIDTYETFINTSDDIDRDAIETGVDKSKMCVATCYNLVHPDISPKGTSMVVISALHMGYEWYSVPPTEYFKIKDKVADDLISLYEKYLCPTVRDAIEVCEIATPVTYYRYSKHLAGTIYGTDNSIYNNPVLKLGVTTPIKNFYFCGSWTEQGGGYSSVLSSGIKAAKKLMKNPILKNSKLKDTSINNSKLKNSKLKDTSINNSKLKDTGMKEPKIKDPKTLPQNNGGK